MSDSDGSDLGAIQEKVHIRKQALESSDLCSAQRPRLLGELGDALMALYNATGNVSTLEDVITAQDSALLLWGSYDNGRMDSLNNLGTALFVFCFNHEPSHFRIHRCVSVFREVLNLTSLDSPERLDAVRDLVEALGYVFEHFGGQETLAEAITLHREALQLCPPGSTRREACLNDLGCKLETRFKSEGNLEALKESVSMHREALALRPFGHPKRDFSANNLANALMSLADQEGGDNLLDEAIALQREALESRPAGHSLRVSSLTNLALALNDMSARGGHTASTELLSEAVDLLREALDLRPVGHSMRHTTLGNLAIVLIAQFRLVGHPDILGDAIELYREAAQLCTPGDPFRAHRLINLSGALFTRYEEQGGSDTLSEAITLGREAVSLSPRGNPYRQTALNTLAISLKAAFYQHSQPDTLTEAMGYLREALSLCPPAHPFRDGLIHNLADLLSILWRVQGDSDALDEAIILSRQALQLLPSGHPYRFLTLGQFGSLMRTKDVCAAVAAYKEALALCPHGQPSRASLLSGIAQCHLLSDTPVFDLPLALKYLSEAVAHDSSSARDRLADALRDLRQAEDVHSLGTRGMETSAKAECDEQLMNVYIQAVRLLPRVGHLGLAHRRRLHAVSSSDDLARNGAARALLLDRIPDAVEVLEEGRGVLWWQALHLRTSFLEGVPAEERAELEQIFRTLDAGSQDVSADIFTGQQREREIESRRHLSDRAETLLARVRLYPGLARTLMPAAFNTLMQSLPTGFVVIVNEAQPSCHALLLNARTKLAVCLELHPLRIQLDSGNLKAGVPRGVSALGAGDEATGLLHDTRAIRVSAKTSDAFEHTLARLWTYVVQPVIDRLGLKRQSGLDRPRVWWCLTGQLSFLPIHAAGIYSGTDSACTSDYCVSSYVPTLSTLIKARANWRPIPRADVVGIVMGEAASEDAFLANVQDEVNAVRDCFDAAGAQVLNEPAAHTTLAEMQSFLESTPAHVLHMACHGVQEQRPMESSFVLHDGRLTIERIMALNLPHAVLAFLSACETAKGSKEHPDQAIHLAASMLFCGFRSVIGTLWLMNDEDGPDLARRVYQRFFEKETLDLDDVPYALDDAVRMLRHAGVPASRWALFVHMGG